jgi:dTDP-4-dehydrorhamnose reductase
MTERESQVEKVLILGVTGMLGHTLLRELAERPELIVRGTARDAASVARHFPGALADTVVAGVEATDFEGVRGQIRRFAPDVVINCIGVIKQDPRVQDPVATITVNSLFPHRLSRECAEAGARLIHVSTDCVFSGENGRYTEASAADPGDLYGRSKLLGEVTAPALVLRTSIIGHELTGHRSLVDWFLASAGTVRGFTRAIYSGITTFEFARLLAEVVIPRPELTGLVHVAADPITKHDLLCLIAEEYDWPGEIVPDDQFSCDRSMTAARLLGLTGYRPPDWPTMVLEMRESAQRWGLRTPGMVAA